MLLLGVGEAELEVPGASALEPEGLREALGEGEGEGEGVPSAEFAAGGVLLPLPAALPLLLLLAPCVREGVGEAEQVLEEHTVELLLPEMEPEALGEGVPPAEFVAGGELLLLLLGVALPLGATLLLREPVLLLLALEPAVALLVPVPEGEGVMELEGEGELLGVALTLEDRVAELLPLLLPEPLPLLLLEAGAVAAPEAPLLPLPLAQALPLALASPELVCSSALLPLP